MTHLLNASYWVLWALVILQSFLLYAALRQIGSLHSLVYRLSRVAPLPERAVPLGTAAEPFALSDLFGHTISLAQFRGHPVILAFVRPDCAPCQRLAKEIRRYNDDPFPGYGQIVFVGRGSPNNLRSFAEKFDVPVPVLIDDGYEPVPGYPIAGTPYILVVDSVGNIAASGGANTAEQLWHLVFEASRSNPRSHIPWGGNAEVVGGQSG